MKETHDIPIPGRTDSNLPKKESLNDILRPVKGVGHYLTFEEEEAEWLFDDEHIVTEEELDAKIKEIFQNVCGEYGKNEFFEFVVPQVKGIYGTNYRKAGLRLLEEIDQGASRKPAEIAEYFRNAIPVAEREFSQKPREEVAAEVYKKIVAIINEERGRFGESYPIEGVFLYGSFPKMNFTLNSDVDCVWLANGKEVGVYVAQDENYVNLIERLEKRVKEETGFEVQPNLILSRVNIMSEVDLKVFASIIKEQFVAENSTFVLLGLDDKKKAEIEKLVEEAQVPSASNSRDSI